MRVARGLGRRVGGRARRGWARRLAPSGRPAWRLGARRAVVVGRGAGWVGRAASYSSARRPTRRRRSRDAAAAAQRYGRASPAISGDRRVDVVRVLRSDSRLASRASIPSRPMRRANLAARDPPAAGSRPEAAPEPTEAPRRSRRSPSSSAGRRCCGSSACGCSRSPSRATSTRSLSAADIVAALYYRVLRHDPEQPELARARPLRALQGPRGADPVRGARPPRLLPAART